MASERVCDFVLLLHVHHELPSFRHVRRQFQTRGEEREHCVIRSREWTSSFLCPLEVGGKEPQVRPTQVSAHHHFDIPNEADACLFPRVDKYLYTPQEIREYSEILFLHLERGAVKPIIHGEYPFTADGVRQAQKDLTSRKTIGKLLIKIA